MSITAFPVIQVNSVSGGSDSLSSGAGPSTAKNGTLAVPTTTTVVIADTVDLSGVLLDGSACLYLADATAGHRNFDQITNITGGPSGSPWTVTVTTGFSTSASNFNWAIGGQRATIAGAVSLKLFNNNTANGDAMPGWAVEMQSGYTETIAATFNLFRAGDFVSGNIELRGVAGAATVPVITFSNNGIAFQPRGLNQSFRNFTMNNSNATKTASVAFSPSGAFNPIQITRITISGSSSGTQFWKAFGNGNGGTVVIEDCYFANQVSNSIDINTNGGTIRLKNSVIVLSGGSGISLTGTTALFTVTIEGCIIAYNTSKGISLSDSGVVTTIVNGYIEDSVIHGNGSDGLNIANASTSYSPFVNLQIENNIFSYNGGYGINLSGAGLNDAFLTTCNTHIRGNAFFTNTSGKYAGMTVASSQYEQTGDPAGGLSSSSKDYTGAAHGLNFQSVAYKGDGYPPGGILYIGNTPGSYQYRDCGLQSQTLPPVHPLIISQPPSPPDW